MSGYRVIARDGKELKFGLLRLPKGLKSDDDPVIIDE